MATAAIVGKGFSARSKNKILFHRQRALFLTIRRRRLSPFRRRMLAADGGAAMAITNEVNGLFIGENQIPF